MTVKTLDIDTTLPADDVQPDKSEMRAKWSEIKTKYETLAGQALRFRGAWSSGSYLSGDVVTSLNGWWRASADITTEVPGTDAEWVLIGTRALIDEDNMASDDATRPPSQQSVKAYVDAAVADLETTIGSAITAASARYADAAETSNNINVNDTHAAFVVSGNTAYSQIVRAIHSTPSTAVSVTMQDTTTAGNSWVIEVPEAQTGTVTLQAADSGTIDGESSITLPSGLWYVKREPGASNNYRTNYTLTVDSIQVVIDDGTDAALTTGVKLDVYVPWACSITGNRMLADASGSVVVDVWNDILGNYPPTDADSITASAPPTITTATNSSDTTLTGWTTTLAAGSTLRFNVDSATTIKRVTLALTVLR